jgi:hypothetical protein
MVLFMGSPPSKWPIEAACLELIYTPPVDRMVPKR